MENPADRYVREHSSPEEDALLWIERQTHLRTNFPQMLCGPVQGRLLRILAGASGARRILEIGSFTGYSAASMALALPEGGMLDALEINDELEDLMREGWERAGVSDKIRLWLGDALESIRTLSQEGARYDLVFIDANKREYMEYYEAIFPLVRPGGLIVADDVLWDGKVYADTVPGDAQTRGIVSFNDFVASDPRVEVAMLPLRHGLSLIRKLTSPDCSL